MAALAVTNPTYIDLANRLGPDNQVTKIIELMNLTNEILDDFVCIEGNLLTGHQTTVRTGIPLPTWRKLYGGVQPSKSTTAKITDSCGMLENYGEIDKALADLNRLAPQWMLSESMPVLEGFNQKVASALFYENEANTPEAITGLSPRYSSLAAENGQNIIDGGGTGSVNCSVWLIVWGESTIHGIYPQGSQGGWQMTNKGQVTVENADGSGGRMEAYRTHYRWDLGLTVRDWRFGVRIANIDNTLLTKTGATGADLIDLMTQAMELVQSLNAGRAAFYCNRKVRSFLRRQMVNKVLNSTLTLETIAGKHVLAFDGVPVRRVDALVNTEARVV